MELIADNMLGAVTLFAIGHLSVSTRCVMVLPDKKKGIYMKKKMSCISLNYRKVLGASSPVLSIGFVNIKNEHFTIRYNFPPDTPKRTERRVSILLNLLQRQQKFNFKGFREGSHSETSEMNI
ncbi:hypothetical protein [Serratia fonticola]|uniref:hypothetical protein n=1 Tax=Serratia fonticola TaxID=47917 RepID=UPI001FD76249|nr:hypothetical protein [Serratia fonticola]